MRIAFSPQRSEAATPVASVNGDRLTLNGDVFDFSGLNEPGDVLPNDAIDSIWIVGARNDAGVTEVTIVLPYRLDQPGRAFPAPVTVTSGEVPMP